MAIYIDPKNKIKKSRKVYGKECSSIYDNYLHLFMSIYSIAELQYTLINPQFINGCSQQWRHNKH